MDSSTTSIYKPEIVSPAGNLEKCKMATAYGADTIYFGGERLNLRVKANNFNHSDIEKLLDHCKNKGVKTVFLLNSFLHEDDIEPAQRYLSEIRKYPFEAVMVSDPGMVTLVKDSGIESAIHLSTQMSTLNHLAVKFWQSAGIKRIVMGRETTLEEVQKIRQHTDAEIEIFIHGALCVAYSGRCLLSRYLTGRDANQGDCSHPCRWNYTLMEKKRPENYLDIIEYGSEPLETNDYRIRGDEGTEILSSMDLCLIEKVEDYAKAGVSAFKIEGRMKSLYYAANTARIYKHAVATAGTAEYKKNIPFWKEELDLISHRPFTDNLFNEFENIGFTSLPYIKKALFLGYKTETGTDQREAIIKTFNPIYLNEEIEAIFPIEDTVKDRKYRILSIKDMENNEYEMARPGDTYKITFDGDLLDHGILRRRLE